MEFVCLARPRQGLATVAQPLIQVKKEEDQEGLVQLADAAPPDLAIESPVVYPSHEEIAFWVGSTGDSEDEDDSTSDQSTSDHSTTAHQPKPQPTATSSDLPAEPSHTASSSTAPSNSVSRNRHQCSVCGKSFAASYLRIHHRVHTGERPFACTFPGCTKAFAQKGTLIVHERLHSNTRPFRCTWPGCEKAFTQNINLNRHTRIHTGNRPFQCTWSGCSKAYTQQQNLTAHLRLHTGQRPYQCQLCSKRFNMKQQLTKHLRSDKHK